METALVTGMFETSFLPEKQVELDVKSEKTGSFSEILESSLKKNDVVKNEIKDCKTEQDVSSENINTKDEILDAEQKTNDEKNTKDVSDIIEEVLDGVKENEGKTKKKDKKIKEEVAINDLVQQSDLSKLIKKEDIKEQDVEIKLEDVKIENQDISKLIESIKSGEKKEVELTPEEKLDDLLSKLDVGLNENVKIKDESENVIEVGPQSVETEKIKLNMNDVDINKDVEEKEDVENLDVLKMKEETLKSEKDDNLKDVDEIGKDKLEDVNELSKKGFENKSLEKSDNQNKTEVDKNKDEKDSGSKNFINQDVNNNETTNKKGFEEDKGLSKQKQDRFKIKDFRTKEDVDITQKFVKEEEVKLENNLEIKDVNNIKKFEDIDVNQMDILDQVTEKLEVSLFDNKSEMVIKLKPNDLGNVTVKITIENGVMNAKFLAESTKVKEALESNLNNLKESLKDQGLNVQDLNVSVDSGRSQNHSFNQNNLIYFNDKKSYQSNKVVSYGESYYEAVNDERKENHYWMDSTVSFLA